MRSLGEKTHETFADHAQFCNANDQPDIASLLSQPKHVWPAPDKLLTPLSQLSERVAKLATALRPRAATICFRNVDPDLWGPLGRGEIGVCSLEGIESALDPWTVPISTI